MTDKALYGLIGNPLQHSFSQDFFTRYFADHKIDAEYRNFELTDIGEVMELVAEYPQLRGFNVTSPYKQQILPYIDTLSDDAKAIGAVNVVRISGSGSDIRFEGFNTDAEGFATDIASFIDRSREALILGSGGAASAVAHGLKSLGVKSTVVSRTPAEGQMAYDELNAERLATVATIINATPLGMEPREAECAPIPYDAIRPDMLCYDLIYNPCPTEFMRRCAARGAAVKGGLGMLIHQALLSWSLWSPK